MKFASVLALAGVAAATPALDKRQVDPISAQLAVLSALPTSLQQLALTNLPAASSEILAEFATGTPTWFQAIPTDVQSYFLSQASDLGITTGAGSAATGSASSAAASITSEVGASVSSAASSLASEASSLASSIASRASSAASAASSAASSAGAAFPTQVAAGGFAGVAGIIALMAL